MAETTEIIIKEIEGADKSICTNIIPTSVPSQIEINNKFTINGEIQNIRGQTLKPSKFGDCKRSKISKIFRLYCDYTNFNENRQ